MAARPEDLESWLPMFESVVAYTSNAAASISEASRYAVSFDGEPLELTVDRVQLRMAADRLGPLVAADERDAAEPVCLQVVGADERVLHRGYLSSPRDRLALAALTTTGLGPWTPSETDPAPPRDARTTARESGMDRADLQTAPGLFHLDSLVLDGGATRYDLLRSEDSPTTRVPPAQVLHMLLHLAEEGVALTVGVPTRGLMHLRSGRIDSLRSGRHGTSVAMGGSTLSIDPRLLDAGFVTRPVDGPAMLELYDRWGSASVVVCCGSPYASREAIVWDHLAAMLSLSGT